MEEQRFNQPWFIALMLITSLSALVPLSLALYNQFILDKPWGDQPLSDSGLLLLVSGMLLVLVAANLIVFLSRLQTKVDKDGVYYRYPPFINKWVHIGKKTITEYNIKRYHPLLDFGGWGYRMKFFFRRKQAFHIKGNIGLYIQLSSGKVLLLGTQKAEMLRSAMKKMMQPSEGF